MIISMSFHPSLPNLVLCQDFSFCENSYLHDALVWGNASPLCALYTRHCLQEMMTHQTKKKTTLTNQMWLPLMNCQVVQASKGKSMLYGPVPSNSQDYTVSATSQCLLWISFMYMHLPLSLAVDNKLWAINNLLIVSLSFWMSLWSFCKIKKKKICVNLKDSWRFIVY